MTRKRILFIVFIALIAAGISLKLFLDSIYRFPVLMYHSIDYTADKKDKLTITPEAFERQMKYLRDNKYNVMPLEDAVSYIKSKKRPPGHAVAITIDDGFANNYTHVYPVLKKYNIPATIFIIVNNVGKKDFLTWDEINRMSKSGLVNIGSHTMNHPMLTYENDKVVKYEVGESKRVLEEKLGKAIDYFCYPAGRHDERIKSAVKLAGYKAAFATKPDRGSSDYDIYEIKRVRISSTADNLFVFGIKSSGYHAFFREMQSDEKKPDPYTKR